MHFTILNMSEDSNKGDLAILESTVWLARKYFPKCKIEVLNVESIDHAGYDIDCGERFRHLRALPIKHHSSFLPHVFAGRKKSEAILFGCRSVVISLWILGAVFILRKHASFFIPRRHQRAYRAIQSGDIVILKGGSYLYSYGGIKDFLFLYRMLLPTIISIWLGKKVVALGHSIGPVVNKPSRTLLRYCLKHFHKVVVREEISRRFVLEELGIDGNSVQLMPDMAFWKRGPDHRRRESANIRSLLETEAGSSDWLNKPKIGLTIRRWNFPLQDNPTERFNNYVSSIVSVINRLHKEYGASVFIMPHAQFDMALGQEIAEKAEGARPIVLRGNYSTSVLRELYAMMDIFIATRIHSGIFALSVGTPVVAIAYEIPKGFGIISMVQGEDHILDIAKIDKEALWQSVQKVFSKKDSMRDAICEKVPFVAQIIEQKYIEVMQSIMEEKQTASHRQETNSV